MHLGSLLSSSQDQCLMLPLPNDGPTAALQALVTATHLPAEQVREHTRAIYQRLLANSPRIKAGNFSVIGSTDLAQLFDHYDERFFQCRVHQALEEQHSLLNFRVAPRMTRAGGKTYRWRPRHGGQGGRFEIAISS